MLNLLGAFSVGVLVGLFVSGPKQSSTTNESKLSDQSWEYWRTRAYKTKGLTSWENNKSHYTR